VSQEVIEESGDLGAFALFLEVPIRTCSSGTCPHVSVATMFAPPDLFLVVWPAAGSAGFGLPAQGQL